MLSYTALQPLCKRVARTVTQAIRETDVQILNVADGRISDVFGRKSALLFATTLFFIGSLMCGAAPDLWTLVAARVVAGLGGGGINTLTTVICSDLVPLRERGKYQGYGNIAYGASNTSLYLNLLLLTIGNPNLFLTCKGWFRCRCSARWIHHRRVWMAILLLHQPAVFAYNGLHCNMCHDKL